MADGLRTVRIVSGDEALLASARGAVEGLEGWELGAPETVGELLARPPTPGDLILLDVWSRDENVYESCRRLAGVTRCRTFVVTDADNSLALPIVQFCGGTGVIERPLSSSKLREALDGALPRPELPAEARRADEPAASAAEGESFDLPQAILKDLFGERPPSWIDHVTDPQTSLYNYGFLTLKLDEEFKRSRRFGTALACVMLGFEGQASDVTLGDLASIILGASRDTDVLGRFDESSFLFLLPSTGPDGARIMAQRIASMVDERGLHDLVGDRIAIAAGISCAPHAEVRRREDLFARARDAFRSALREGRAVRTEA